MYKLLVVTCLLVSCMAGPLDLPTRIRDIGIRWRARGCADRAAGWEACASANSSDALALAPHPYDCRLFYYCSSARPACRRCPAGLHFNAELQVCDWPQSANCTAPPPRPRPPRPSLPPRYNTTTISNTSATDFTFGPIVENATDVSNPDQWTGQTYGPSTVPSNWTWYWYRK